MKRRRFRPAYKTRKAIRKAMRRNKNRRKEEPNTHTNTHTRTGRFGQSGFVMDFGYIFLVLVLFRFDLNKLALFSELRAHRGWGECWGESDARLSLRFLLHSHNHWPLDFGLGLDAKYLYLYIYIY